MCGNVLFAKMDTLGSTHQEQLLRLTRLENAELATKLLSIAHLVLKTMDLVFLANTPTSLNMTVLAAKKDQSTVLKESALLETTEKTGSVHLV